MNYYPRHIGDYAKDTGHLSMLEHGAYTLLLDRYYSTESGIPDDQKYRLARARTKEEKEAVDVVLGEFFTLANGIWTKPRCDAEIAKAQKKIAAAVTNGANGGRPRKNPEETQEKPSGLSVGSDLESQLKALQSPISNNQIRASERAPDPIPEDPPNTEAAAKAEREMRRCGEYAVTLTQAGMRVTSMDPRLVAWVQQGYLLNMVLDALARAKTTLGQETGINAGYVDKILRDPKQNGAAVSNVAPYKPRPFPKPDPNKICVPRPRNLQS